LIILRKVADHRDGNDTQGRRAVHLIAVMI